MKPAGGVAEDDVHAARFRRGKRVKQHRAGVRPLFGAHKLTFRAVRPDLQLIRGRGAEGVRRAQQHAPALLLEAVRQLADGGRLADAVDADDQHDRRLRGKVKRGIADAQLLLQNVAQRLLDALAVLDFVVVNGVAQPFDRVRCDARAEVSHDEAFLQLVIKLLVDRFPNDGVIPRLFDLCKNSHSILLLSCYSLMFSSLAILFMLMVSTLLTPRSCIVTPYSTSAASIVPRRCVMTMNCVFSVMRRM